MRNNIATELDKLTNTDIYSLILFALYKIQDIPEYSSLSELVYLLDKESLYNLLTYYGGMTIKIPTIKELNIIINALLVYQLVNIENKTIDEAKKEIDTLYCSPSEVIDTYYKLVEILDKYSFSRK